MTRLKGCRGGIRARVNGGVVWLTGHRATRWLGMGMRSQWERQEEGRLRAECWGAGWGRLGAAGQRVPPGPGERSSVPVEAELRFRYLQLGKRQRRPLLALAARVAVDGLPARGGVVAEGGAGAARPSKWESRATCGADAARGERGAYVTFTDRIPRSVGGEIEQTGEEMWQQPLSTAGRYFSSSFTPALAWCVVDGLVAGVSEGQVLPHGSQSVLGVSEGIIWMYYALGWGKLLWKVGCYGSGKQIKGNSLKCDCMNRLRGVYIVY